MRYSISDLGRFPNLPNRTTISGWVSDYEEAHGENSFRSRGHKAPGGAVVYDLVDINELLAFKGYEPLQPPQPKVEVLDEPIQSEVVPMPGDIVFNPSKLLGLTGGSSVSVETFDAIAQIFDVAKQVVETTIEQNEQEFIAFAASKRLAESKMKDYQEAMTMAKLRAHTTELLKSLAMKEAADMAKEVDSLQGDTKSQES